ncbi:MAG: aldehyde dehydrogenase family protein [Bacillus sp. (in: firmicutes)]
MRLAKPLSYGRELFINGKWKPAKHYIEINCPFSGDVIGTIPLANEEETNEAIGAAFASREIMRRMPSYKRAEILERLVVLLSERKEESAAIISLEAGKPIKAAREEVERTILTYKFSAEEAKRIQGETLALDAAPGGVNRIGYTVKRPIGVIGAITPFNFPMNLVAHKVGPAIAAGNTVVLKPASQTPFSSYYIAELLQEAGLPDGCLNVITGQGATVGEQLVMDDRISKITFTGSPEVGKRIRNEAGLKKVTLELGSNAALIIDRQVDIDAIIDRCVEGAFSYQGQVCISLQRIFICDELYDSFLNKFRMAVESLSIGDPIDENTDLSSLISPRETQRALNWIVEATKGGAKAVTGGKTSGSVLLPTILTDATEDMKVSCMEVFAPIVVVTKISSVAEGIKKVNDSRFGLQAGIYTNDLQTALHAAEELEAGGIIINDIPTFRVDQMPYGGVKESGIGREGVKYAMEDMMELKSIIFKKD